LKAIAAVHSRLGPRYLGRPTGFAAVGLLQVRAFALIPFGDWLRQPCASLAQRTASARTSLIRPVLRQVEALAARRSGFASASGGSAVLLGLSPCPVTLRPRGRGTGCACKGVFIKLRFTNLPPCSPVPAVAVVHRAKDSGERRPVPGRRPMRTPPLHPRGSRSRSPASLQLQLQRN